MIQRLFRNYGAKWSLQGATQWLSHDTGAIPNVINFIKEIILPFTRLIIILIIFIINVITIIIIIITRRSFPAKLLLHWELQPSQTFFMILKRKGEINRGFFYLKSLFQMPYIIRGLSKSGPRAIISMSWNVTDDLFYLSRIVQTLR